MKMFAILGALGALAVPIVPAAAYPASTPICIRSYDIDRTTVVNPQKILFRLKDGKVYASNLRAPCLGLKFDGFVYVTSMDEICGGSQTIRVLRTKEVCVLGPFEPANIGQHNG